MKLRDVVIELQSFGLIYDGEVKGRKGGAGPSEGITLLLSQEGMEVSATVPFYSWYVKFSPYKIVERDGKLNLFKNGIPLPVEVKIPEEPRYYSMSTEEGVPLWKIALLHGRDCLGTTLFQRCMRWMEGRKCGFCGIELSLREGKTLPFKKPAEVYRVCKLASETDGVKHITITTGTQKDRKEELFMLAEAGEWAKKGGLDVHIQFAPVEDLSLLNLLKEKRADTAGIHIETFDPEVLKKISPWKAEAGLKLYIKNWEKAVETFGRGQVESFLIIGLGESLKKTMEGVRLLCSIGVVPYPVPFRPLPGTPLYRKTPPSPEVMKRVYAEIAGTMHSYGINPLNFKAGCVRCGSCSAIGFFFR